MYYRLYTLIVLVLLAVVSPAHAQQGGAFGFCDSAHPGNGGQFCGNTGQASGWFNFTGDVKNFQGSLCQPSNSSKCGYLTVLGFQGIPLNGTPTNGQTWCFIAANNDYEPCTGGGGGGGGAATQLQFGPTVQNLSANAPTPGQILSWNGTTIGGTAPVPGNTLGAHIFANSISNPGVIAGVQPSCSDLSNAAASCSTNALNASNINTGFLSSSLGGAGGITGPALLKGTAGVVTAAVANSDYAAAPTGAANTPLFNGGSGTFINGTRSGNTTEVASFSGSATASRCIHTDANGNLIVAGADCGTSSGVTYATVVNTSGIAPTVTCTANSGGNPTRDMIWQVLTANTTYTTVPSATNCVNGDIIEAYFIQADNGSFTVTLADGTGTNHVGNIYTEPTSNGVAQGHFLHFAWMYHTQTTQWELIFQDTNPLTPVQIAEGGTASTTGELLTPTSTNANVFDRPFDFVGVVANAAIEHFPCIVTMTFPSVALAPAAYQALCKTAPTATASDYKIKVAGTQTGDVSFAATTGTPTITVAAGFTCTAGQDLEIDAPATTHSEADCAINLVYTR